MLDIQALLRASHSARDPDPLPELAKLQATLSDALASAGALSSKSQLLESQFVSPAGGVARVFASAASLNILVAQYIVDFEYSIREIRAKSLASPIQVPPMNFTGGIWTVNIVVDKTFEFGWATLPGQKPRHDSVLFDLQFELFINGASNGKRIMRLEAVLTFDPRSKKVGFVLAKAIRFISPSGDDLDFMQTVPRENGLREDMRANLYKNVTQAIANAQIAINAPTDPGLPTLTMPLTYRVADYIGFIVKTLPMRRERRLLTYYFPNYYPEALCLKRDYVDAEFAKKIQAVGASQQRISYSFSNSLNAAVFKFYADGECWVSVEVSMNLNYTIRLSNNSSANIVATADLGYWSAHIEIDNCWPKCGDIMDEVKAKIREQIDANKRIVLQFADLSAYAVFAAAHIDLDGITIFMEPR